MENNSPFISVVVPCCNEEKFIGKCLNSIIAQDYPRDKYEILVIDGMSNDKTREIVEDCALKYFSVKSLNNPNRITSHALNLGIRNAKGKLILWMSAHNEYKKEYISKCVRYLDKFHADAVGGVIKPIPRNNSVISKSICIAISHPFGVGRSAHKIGINNPRWVDTAFGVCYKKEVFDKIGFFNEKLIRGQDMEFSLRMKKAGFKTLLVPEITSYYYARSDLKTFIRYNHVNGMWAILPFKYTNIMPVSLRHLVPLAFVLSLIFFGIFSFFSFIPFLIFSFIFSVYLLANFYFSIKIAMEEKDLTLLFSVPLTFFILHFSYGLGSVCGLIKLVFIKADSNQGINIAIES